MRKYAILTILVLGTALILWGCGKLENKGTRPENQIPIVYLGNVPPENSEFSINPRIYWYGMDPDGYITRYQYAVIPESVKDSAGNIKNLGLIPKTSDGWVDSLFVKALESVPADDWVDTLIAKHLEGNGFFHFIPSDSMVVVDDSVTEQNVRMFAELDPQKFVSQYIFIRGVDNSKGISKIWNPEGKGGNTFRRFSRNNHAPNTHIKTDKFDKRIVYYSLPETTQTWKGIEILWEGSDSLDYPRKQPDFMYKWELLGPFADTASIDSFMVPSPVVDSSYDSLLDTRWTGKKSKVFKNLENYNEPEGISGWYLFRVRSKDDAEAVDETPAYTFFQVVHPYFSYTKKRRVLLVDAARYKDKDTYAIVVPFETARKYYQDILNELSGEMGFDYDFWVDPYHTPFEMHLPPNEHTLSLYDLVIVMHYGAREEGLSSTAATIPTGGAAPSDSGYIQYKRYLDVGGEVWLIGANNFGLGATAHPGFHVMDPRDRTSEFSQRTLILDLGRYYFGIYGVFYPCWLSDTLTQNEEFIAADPYAPGSGFPRLEVDPLLTATSIWTNPGFTPKHKEAVPLVNYEVLGPKTERLYTFISYKGGLSEMNGRPCASRFIGPTYRTAEFCFPLFAINKEKSKEVFRLMLNWFFE